MKHSLTCERVRGAVAAISFDNFHRNSAKVIRAAVFGVDENEKIRNKFHFSANNLVITNIDIQSVEPVDQRTRDRYYYLISFLLSY